MNRSWVQSGGLAASSTRLYIRTSLEPDAGRASDDQAFQPAGRADLARGHVVGDDRTGATDLAEVELGGPGRAHREGVVRERPLLALGEVALHRLAAAREVGRPAVGGEQDGEREAVV